MRFSTAVPPTGVLGALFRLAKPYRRQFALILALALLGVGADLLQPLIYKIVINDVAGLFVGRPSPHATPVERQHVEAERSRKTSEAHRRGYVAPRTHSQAFSTLIRAVALLLAIGLAGYLFSLAADYQSTMVASRIEASLIQSAFGHVLKLPLSFFGGRSSGGLAKRIDQCDQVAPVVTAFSQQIAPEALRIVGICVIMFTQSWRLALAALVVVPMYLVLTRRAARRLESGMNEYYQMWEDVSALIQSAITAIKTVKLAGAEAREAGHLQSAARTAYDDYLERTRLGNRYLFLQNALNQISKALVLGYGGWMVLEQRLTPGDVVMFVAYLDRLFDPIESLSGMAVTLQQNMASLSRAVRLLDTGPEERRGAELACGAGKVEFRDVHFSYRPEREVLCGFSLTIEPGRTVALTGPSGAGKTTAADLLLKLWEPDSGEIRIDGQALSTLDPASVRRQIGMVSSDGAVFRGSLAANIRYKRPDASDAEVRQAALAAGLGPTIDRLPDGLDAEVGERGVGLSVGERQRLQLARILVAEPRILVLDEATANLDYATEAEVRAALARLESRPSTLVIAHRYSMLKDADRVIVLDQGSIREQGSPAELIAAGGWFSQLAAQATVESAAQA